MKPNCEIEADLELTVCVEAEIGGRYIPASIEGPAEYPGIEALRITLEGIDITEAIGYKTKEYLEEVVMEEFDAEREVA